MAVIKNTIKNIFQTQGANKTVKATGQVTKAETRLGQATASAGRQFSAQAQAPTWSTWLMLMPAEK